MAKKEEFDIKIKEPDIITKEQKLQFSGRQYSIQIPVDIIDALDLDKGDVFIFKVPLKNKKNYSIKIKKLE